METQLANNVAVQAPSVTLLRFDTRAECAKFYADPSTYTGYPEITWSPPPFQPNISFIEKCHFNNPFTDFTRCEIDPFCVVSDALGTHDAKQHRSRRC